MREEELRETVMEVLAEIAPEVDISQIQMDVELRDQIEIDSMDLLNLAIGVHERTRVDIPESEYAKLGSIDALVSYLAARLE